MRALETGDQPNEQSILLEVPRQKVAKDLLKGNRMLPLVSFPADIDTEIDRPKVSISLLRARLNGGVFGEVRWE